MLPSLWPGDLLTIQSAAYDEIAPGDIVLVLRDDRFFIHRLVERRLGQDCLLWITRGDAMPHNDPPAAASELLGRVASIRRGNRSFVPSRRVSPLHSALAWMLCHWDRFRSLALRIHAAMSAGRSDRAARQIVFAAYSVRYAGFPALLHLVLLIHDDCPSHDRERDRIHRDRRNGDCPAHARSLISSADRESLCRVSSGLRRVRTSSSTSTCASHRNPPSRR